MQRYICKLKDSDRTSYSQTANAPYTVSGSSSPSQEITINVNKAVAQTVTFRIECSAGSACSYPYFLIGDTGIFTVTVNPDYCAAITINDITGLVDKTVNVYPSTATSIATADKLIVTSDFTTSDNTNCPVLTVGLDNADMSF